MYRSTGITGKHLRHIQIAIVVTSMTAIASATYQTDGNPWEEDILRADFVGVVECTKTENVVADCVVLEVWRTNAPVERIKAMVPWGRMDGLPNDRPVLEEGVRYVVVAFDAESGDHEQTHSLVRYHDVPVSSGPRPVRFEGFGWYASSFDEFAREVKGFLRRADRDPELTLITTLAEQRLRDVWGDTNDAKTEPEWGDRLPSATILDAALKRLVLIYGLGDTSVREKVLWVLRHGGMERTLSYLEELKRIATPIHGELDPLLQAIRYKLD